MYFHTVNEIKQAARDNGNHFFDLASMRFFSSRVGYKVYGGKYFITSEQFVTWYPEYHQEPRKYTIRAVIYHDGQFGIEDIGEFQQYETREAAAKVAERLGAHRMLELATA
jgi:hypothetical protein